MPKTVSAPSRRIFWLISLTLIFTILIAQTVEIAHVKAGSAGAAPIQRQFTDGPQDPAELEGFLDGVLMSQMQDKHIAGATLAVVKDGQVVLTKGYGYVDVSNRTPVDPATSLFRIGSITKTFTWTAVMQLVERGEIDLDADINTYLDFKIPDTFPEPITMVNLLTHTPGFEDRAFGMAAATPEKLVPLGKWLAENIPARVFPPGKLVSYSNYGATLAGYIVERVSGISYDEYIERYILQPLGLEHITSRQPLPASLEGDMSGGFKFVGNEFQVQEFELLQVPPAGSISASASDMAIYMIAHLQYGIYGQSRILQEATSKEMQSILFTQDARLNGMCYGFYEMSRNGQRIIGHGGDTIWFHSLMALLPEQKLGLFVSYNTSTGSSQPDILLDRFLDHYYPFEVGPIKPMAGAASQLKQYTGSYEILRRSFTTSEKAAGLASFLPLSATKNGMLSATTPVGQQRFVEVEPDVFREVDTGDYLIFRKDAQGRVQYGYLSAFPVITIAREYGVRSHYFQYALLGIIVLLFSSVLIVFPVGFFVRRSYHDKQPQPRLARLGRWGLFLLVILFFAFVIIFASMVNNPLAILTGEVQALPYMGVFLYGIVLFAILSVFIAALAWIKRYWSLSGRLHFSLVALASGALVWILFYWNFLGSRF